MNRKYILDLRVRDVDHVGMRYTLLKLTSDAPLPDMSPGQFVEVRVDGSPSTFLRRPISIHNVIKESNELWLLVAAVGDGTRQLSLLQPGDTLNCVLPLGHGFTLPQSDSEQVLLVGGGVGVAPLLFLGHRMAEMGVRPTFLLGARTAADLAELDLFGAVGDVFVTTEDGTRGEKGFVTQHSLLGKRHFSRIYTCGPKPMMAAVGNYAIQKGIDCEVSLENNMACGLGACLCCVEKTTTGNVCVCKEGPVLNFKRLLWHL